MSEHVEKYIPPYLKESKIFNVNATDMEGNFIYVNKAFQERFSFITDDFMGFYSLKTIYHEDHLACYEAVNQCIKNPSKPARVQLRKPIENSDEVEWTEWEFSMLFNENKQPLGILCVGYSISELKRSLKVLEKQNEQLALVAQQQAHQMRGPITTLLMALEVFKKDDEYVLDKTKVSLLTKAIEQTENSIKEMIEEYIEKTNK